MGSVTAMAVKTATASVEVDEALGEVVAMAAVTNTVDTQRELIEPGAFADTLRGPRPYPLKVLADHDVSTWGLAALEHAEELLPGDPRLPRDLLAKGAGALVVVARYDLSNPTAASMFRRVALDARSGGGQWSIGYVVREEHNEGRVRHLDTLELLEVSAVAFGANPSTRTLATKSARRHHGAAAALMLAAAVAEHRRKSAATAALLAG